MNEPQLNIETLIAQPEEKLSHDARLIKNYYLRLIRNLPNNVYWLDKNCITLGCNRNVLKFVGLDKFEDFIGITYQQMGEIAGWNKGEAQSFEQDDMEVMRTGKPILNKEEPVFYDAEGKPVYYLSNRIPLFDDDGNVIGVAGISVDVTAMKEAGRLQAEIQKKILAEEERYRKNLEQFVHDVKSPLASAMMILKACNELPESKRTPLRDALMRIDDMTKNLLKKYGKEEEQRSFVAEKPQPILVSAALLELLTEKKYAYQNFKVKFEHEFKDHFTFINIEPNAFKRAISNLINNAVDAFEQKSGKVTVTLEASEAEIKISIQDNGKGMPPELIDKIMRNIAFTAGKNEGHGIGLTQVRETLQRNQGNLILDSQVGQGTKVMLTFPRIKAPQWIAENIELNSNDLIIILDDDDSIHAAWNAHLAIVLKDLPNIKIHHFRVGQEASHFINSLSIAEKNRTLLLTDFELLHQELNGLQVVAITEITRAILVTSHYANPAVREQALKLGIKILPKQLASEIPIKLSHDYTRPEPEAISSLRKVDLVLVEDDKIFAQNLIDFIFYDKVVDYFQDPMDFLENWKQYSKETKIFLDNNFNNGLIKGLEIAREMYKQGFSKLYMITGESFRKEEIPDYLTVISKTDLNSINLYDF